MNGYNRLEMIQLSDETKFKIQTDEQYKLSTHTRYFC